jgi:hypothetical protein
MDGFAGKIYETLNVSDWRHESRASGGHQLTYATHALIVCASLCAAYVFGWYVGKRKDVK